MAFKYKFSYEEKENILSEYLDGTYGFREVCRRYNIRQGSLKNWKRLYETFGWRSIAVASNPGVHSISVQYLCAIIPLWRNVK